MMDSSSDLRCKRTGRSPWRCNEMAMPGRSLCEKHQLQRELRNQRIKQEKRAEKMKISGKIADEDISGEVILRSRAEDGFKRRKNLDEEEEDDDDNVCDEGRMVRTQKKRGRKPKVRCGVERSGDEGNKSNSGEIGKNRVEKHANLSKSLFEFDESQRNSWKNWKESGYGEANGISKIRSLVTVDEPISCSELLGDITEWRIPFSRRDGTVEMVPIPRAPDMPELVFPGVEHVPMDNYRKLAELTFSMKRMYQRHYFEHQGERGEWESKMAQVRRENDELRSLMPQKP